MLFITFCNTFYKSIVYVFFGNKKSRAEIPCFYLCDILSSHLYTRQPSAYSRIPFWILLIVDADGSVKGFAEDEK